MVGDTEKSKVKWPGKDFFAVSFHGKRQKDTCVCVHMKNRETGRKGERKRGKERL
jgi:hypothetical protein